VVLALASPFVDKIPLAEYEPYFGAIHGAVLSNAIDVANATTEPAMLHLYWGLIHERLNDMALRSGRL